MNGPPYDVYDPNPYSRQYLSEVDPKTGSKNNPCDLPFHKELKPKKKEDEDDEGKDENYIAYYSTLF